MSILHTFVDVYKAKLVQLVRTEVGQLNETVVWEIIAAFAFFEVIVLWRVSCYVATRHPDIVAAIRGLVFSAIVVFSFWMYWLFVV